MDDIMKTVKEGLDKVFKERDDKKLEDDKKRFTEKFGDTYYRDDEGKLRNGRGELVPEDQ